MTLHCCLVMVLSLTLLSSSSADGPDQKKDRGVSYWCAELERGYRATSQKPLITFLETWCTDSTPLAQAVMKKKLRFEQEVYAIYSTFYTPATTHKYVIVQDEITVVLVDSDLRREFAGGVPKHCLDRTSDLLATSTVVVKDFRPTLKVSNGTRILYRQEKYLAPLVGFLTQHEKPLSLVLGDRYQWEENGTNQRRRRLEYLNETLNIGRGLWMTGWFFETGPTVSTVYLSSDMERAIVLYRLRHGLGEALLEKAGGQTWELRSMRINAIE